MAELRRQFFFDGLQCEIDPGKGLTGFIMQFACDPSTLQVLRMKQLGRQPFKLFAMLMDSLMQACIFDRPSQKVPNGP